MAVPISPLMKISTESWKLESGAKQPAARYGLEGGSRIWNQGQESSSGVREPEAGLCIQRVYKKPLHFKPSPHKKTKAECSRADSEPVGLGECCSMEKAGQ